MARQLTIDDSDIEIRTDALPHQDAKNTRSGRHQYSLVRAFREATGAPGSFRPKGFRIGGLEGEVSEELEKRYDRTARGFFVPGDVLAHSGMSSNKYFRNLSMTTGSGAVPTIVAGDDLVAAMRPRMVVAALGGNLTNIKPNMAGKLSVPRVATGTAVAWVSEGSAPEQSTATIDSIALTPRTVTAWTAITHTMVRSADTPEFDRVIASDIGRSIAVELDRVAIAGDGMGNTPVGALYASGVDIQAVGANGGAPTRALLLEMEAAVGEANGDASAASRMAWVSSPKGRKALRSVDATAGNGRWLWADDDTILGSPAVATKGLPADLAKGSGTDLTALLYGDFSRLLVNFFSPVDVLIDPYKITVDGCLHVNVYLDADVGLLTPGSFSACSDLATS